MSFWHSCMSPDGRRQLLQFGAICLVAAILVSCSDQGDPLVPPSPSCQLQATVSENYALVRAESFASTLDTAMYVNIGTDSILYSAAVTRWAQGVAMIDLLSASDDHMRLDTLKGDTLLSRMPSIQNFPWWIRIQLRDFTGSLRIELAKMPPGPGPPDTVATLGAEFDFEVMEAVLGSIVGRADTLIVSDSTRVRGNDGITDGFVEGQTRSVRYSMPSLRESTIRSFLAKNSSRARLRDSLQTTRPCLYFPLGNGLKEWELRHPLITLSRVGYSPDKTQALVYLSVWGSYGEYYLLRRQSGIWEVVESVMDWIA